MELHSNQFLNINNIVNSQDFTKQDFLDMVVMAFHCRECHGDGKGERDAFFYMFLKLQSIIRMRCLQFWILFQNMDVGKIIKK